MKRWFLVLLLILGMAGAASGAQMSAGVQDAAGLMTQREADALGAQLQSLSREYDLNIYILTVDTLEGKSPQQYADDFYDRTFGAGSDGILFLLSMQERDWYISTSGRGRTLLTDEEIYDAMESVVPHLSAGDYYRGFTTWVSTLSRCLPEPEPSFWIALGIGGVVALISVLVMRFSMNTKRKQHSAQQYLQADTYQLTAQQDFFLYRNVTKTARPKESHSTGSSGGRSHGGGGGKF